MRSWSLSQVSGFDRTGQPRTDRRRAAGVWRRCHVAPSIASCHITIQTKNAAAAMPGPSGAYPVHATACPACAAGRTCVQKPGRLPGTASRPAPAGPSATRGTRATRHLLAAGANACPWPTPPSAGTRYDRDPHRRARERPGPGSGHQGQPGAGDLPEQAAGEQDAQCWRWDQKPPGVRPCDGGERSGDQRQPPSCLRSCVIASPPNVDGRSSQCGASAGERQSSCGSVANTIPCRGPGHPVPCPAAGPAGAPRGADTRTSSSSRVRSTIAWSIDSRRTCRCRRVVLGGHGGHRGRHRGGRHQGSQHPVQLPTIRSVTPTVVGGARDVMRTWSALRIERSSVPASTVPARAVARRHGPSYRCTPTDRDVARGADTAGRQRSGNVRAARPGAGLRSSPCRRSRRSPRRRSRACRAPPTVVAPVTSISPDTRRSRTTVS